MARLCSTTVRESFQKTGGSCCCEPYVLVTSVDLSSARPEVEAFLYGPWQATNPKDTADIVRLVWRESFWKLDIVANPIAKPDDVIFLIALMEHFDGDQSIIRFLIKQAVIDALSTSACLAREILIARLIDDVNTVVDLANGGPNFISAVEMVLTTEEIGGLEANGCCSFLRSFCGYGGQYCLGIELINEEPYFRDLVSQQDEAFACAAE